MGGFAPVQGSAARVYIDEFELTQQSSGAELNVDFDTISYNIMGSPSTYQDATSPSFSIPHHGYYTGKGAGPDLGYFEDTVQKRLGTATPVVVTLILGPVAYTLIGTWGSQMTIDAPVDGLITIDANWSSPDSIVRGAASIGQTYASGGVSPAIDLGAAAFADGAVFHVSGFADLSAGAELVTAKIQTASTSGGTYTDWLTTTFQKPGAKLVTGADNPQRWARVSVLLTAGVPGPITVFASIKYK